VHRCGDHHHRRFDLPDQPFGVGTDVGVRDQRALLRVERPYVGHPGEADPARTGERGQVVQVGAAMSVRAHQDHPGRHRVPPWGSMLLLGCRDAGKALSEED
jgi:hypothetical protein